jgi:hypothetical protein
MLMPPAELVAATTGTPPIVVTGTVTVAAGVVLVLATTGGVAVGYIAVAEVGVTAGVAVVTVGDPAPVVAGAPVYAGALAG